MEAPESGSVTMKPDPRKPARSVRCTHERPPRLMLAVGDSASSTTRSGLPAGVVLVTARLLKAASGFAGLAWSVRLPGV